MSTPSARRYFALAALVIFFTGCGDRATEPPPPPPPPPEPPAGTPGLTIVAGAGVTDTVDAEPVQALVVEVRDTRGKIASGAVVRFQSRPPSDPTRQSEGAVFVCALTAVTCFGSPFVADTTDLAGRASAVIRLGTVPGKAVVLVTVPDLGLADSATFTVTVGAAARIIVSPQDTTIDIGSTVTVQAVAADRRGNARSEAPALSTASGSAVTVDAASNVVTGRDMGTQAVYARLGQVTDSAVMRVRPTGRLLVWSPALAIVRLMDINGKNQQTVVANVGSDYGAFPRFGPSRQGLTLHSAASSYAGPSRDAIVIDTTGSPRRDISGFNSIIAVRQTDDGNVMVVGRRTGDPGWYAVFRITADNTITLLKTLDGFSDIYGSVDITYDGKRVAYIDGNALAVLDVSTGALTILDGAARGPRWSVQGDRLVYLTSPSSCPDNLNTLDGLPTVINTDGSGRRVLGNFCFSSGLGWSPDGKYIVGRAGGGYALGIVRLSDGMDVFMRYRDPDTFFIDYCQPDWR
jgi:hypothetical protein